MKGAKGKRKYPNALPAMSVETVEDAESLQTLTCSYLRDGRYSINRSSGFVQGDVDSMEAAGEYLAKSYEWMQAKGEKRDDR